MSTLAQETANKIASTCFGHDGEFFPKKCYQIVRDALIAAAAEKEKELAALKERVSILNTTCECHRKVIEQDEEQHSADLLAIAEMSIASHRQYTAKALTWNGGKEPEEPTADSILREFREKKAHRETVCKEHGVHLCGTCFPNEKGVRK